MSARRRWETINAETLITLDDPTPRDARGPDDLITIVDRSEAVLRDSGAPIYDGSPLYARSVRVPRWVVIICDFVPTREQVRRAVQRAKRDEEWRRALFSIAQLSGGRDAPVRRWIKETVEESA